MLRILLTVLICYGLACGGASAQKTQTQLLAEITTNIPSGQPTVLTAASLRAVLNDMVNSSYVAFFRPTPSTLNQAFNSSQSIAGSGAGNVAYNQMVVTSDTAAISASGGLQAGIGYIYNMIVGGAGMTGSRQAIAGNVQLIAAGTGAVNRFYAGGAFGAQASSADNGTNTGAGALGTLQGFITSATATSGATNLFAVNGMESDIIVATGATTKNKLGYLISQSPADAVAGANFAAGGDAAMSFSNQSGTAPGWTTLVSASFVSGQSPFAATGCFVCTYGAHTFTTGIDFSSSTITGNFLRGPNFFVKGDGTQLGINATAAIGGSTLTVHHAANQNLVTYPNVNGGVNINGLNDAGNANIPITITATNIFFQPGGANNLELYTSGGMALGATIPGDPGVNNFRAAGVVRADTGLQSTTTTVASLATCNAANEGLRSYVTDQNTAVAYRGAVTGSGATRQAVLCSNSAWIQD